MADSRLTSVIKKTAGKVGRAIDVGGRALGSKIPEISKYGGEGLSGYLEQVGASALTPTERVVERVSQEKPIAVADAPLASSIYHGPVQTTQAGITPQSSGAQKVQQAGGITSAALTREEATSQTGLPVGELWDKKEFEKDGVRYQVTDNRDGTFSFNQMQTGGGDEAPPPLSQEQVSAGISGAGEDILKNLRDTNMEDIFSKQYANTEELASELERVARENADRDYGDVLSALGLQREEVTTLSGQQKTDIGKDVISTEAELARKSEKEQKQIGEEKAGFKEDVAETKDQLAKTWREMSLRTQRLMRGRGMTDSSFASSEETKVLLDFNKGLRQLAVKSTGALKDFSDAVTETVSFYERKKVELAEEARRNVQSIDNWVRQTTNDIQGQENVAMSQKLKEINQAVLKAQELRTNVANQILNKKLDYDMWLKQTEVNYKLSVAQAATGKVESAYDQIKKSAEVSRAMSTLLENGQASFTTDDQGNVSLTDSVTGSAIPTRPGFQSSYEEEQALERQKLESQASGSNVFGNIFGAVNPATTPKDDDLLSSAIQKTSIA